MFYLVLPLLSHVSYKDFCAFHLLFLFIILFKFFIMVARLAENSSETRRFTEELHPVSVF